MNSFQPMIPMLVKEVFGDFKDRRAGVIKALTTDVEKFYEECDPNKENLCLYGLPSEKWEVVLPGEEVPPVIPEPALGINFARDGMIKRDWLSSVAVHSDAWLVSVAFYFGARSGFLKSDRKKLFNMINKLPTVFEVVTGQGAEPKEATRSNKSKSKSNGNVSRISAPNKAVKMTPPPIEEDESDRDEKVAEAEGEQDEQGNCGVCGVEYYADNEFWICCGGCDRWYHGKCVKITPAKAKHMERYKCHKCHHKRAP